MSSPKPILHKSSHKNKNSIKYLNKMDPEIYDLSKGGVFLFDDNCVSKSI